MAFQGLPLVGKRQQWCYIVEVVAQHATELPLPAGARALFLLKRRHRLSVTEAEPVDAAGGVEWNTRCSQTATLYKQGDGWRPKEFALKVQAVPEGKAQLGPERAQTVAKAKLDFSQFCLPEPFGPKQLVIPLQPCGVLSVSIRTQYLQNYSRETDSLTDISYLSLAPSAVTSMAGMPLAMEEQDLSGFDSMAAAGGIQAAWQPQLAAGQEQGAAPGTARKRMPPALRLPWRSTSAGGSGGGDACEQQPPGALHAAQPAEGQQGSVAAGRVLQRSATLPSLSVGGAAAGPAGSGGAGGNLAIRRPPGASLLQLPHLPGAAACEAETPTLFGAAKTWKQQEQQQQQAQPARGLPPEAWTPIDLQEAVDQLYDSDEEPTPKPTVLGTMKRMVFSGKPRNAMPPAPGSGTARQLHKHFGTPQPSPPRVTPDPCEVATIDRESSVSTLRRRCKRLLAERDEARAESYAEATLAVELSVEVDKLTRTKEMLLQRLATTEEQLLACFRDEASTDLIRALAATRVEAAQQEFQLMQLQGELRRRDAAIDKLRARLTRAETKYRLQVAGDQPSAGPAAATTAGGAAPTAAEEQPAACILRRYRPSDQPQVRHICRNVYDGTDTLPDRIDGEAARPDTHVLVAAVAADDSVAALLCCRQQGNVLFLYGARTHEDMRRRGLAELLLAEAEELARSLPGVAALLSVTVPDNGTMRGIFARRGFRQQCQVVNWPPYAIAREVHRQLTQAPAAGDERQQPASFLDVLPSAAGVVQNEAAQQLLPIWRRCQSQAELEAALLVLRQQRMGVIPAVGPSSAAGGAQAGGAAAPAQAAQLQPTSNAFHWLPEEFELLPANSAQAEELLKQGEVWLLPAGADTAAAASAPVAFAEAGGAAWQPQDEPLRQQLLHQQQALQEADAQSSALPAVLAVHGPGGWGMRHAGIVAASQAALDSALLLAAEVAPDCCCFYVDRCERFDHDALWHSTAGDRLDVLPFYKPL
ncbi:hypothetical protein ABPG75_012561 [Micractinium tetrahymenae]